MVIRPYALVYSHALARRRVRFTVCAVLQSPGMCHVLARERVRKCVLSIVVACISAVPCAGSAVSVWAISMFVQLYVCISASAMDCTFVHALTQQQEAA
jgi:hypothetical protein